MTLTLINPKESVQTSYEHNITKYASSARQHKCLKENCDNSWENWDDFCLGAPSDVLSEAEWMWLIQNVDSFLDGAALCKGGYQWLIFPRRQDSFVKSCSCQNEASALFFCCLMAGVMSQSTWEGRRPGKHWAWKWRRGIVMDALSSPYRAWWHMFNLGPAAPVDMAGWDFTQLWRCVRARVHVSEREFKI